MNKEWKFDFWGGLLDITCTYFKTSFMFLMICLIMGGGMTLVGFVFDYYSQDGIHSVEQYLSDFKSTFMLPFVLIMLWWSSTFLRHFISLLKMKKYYSGKS